MKAKKLVVSNKFIKLNDKFIENLYEAACHEARQLNKYNKKQIKLSELNPKIPHNNIYGILFQHDSNEKSLRVIKESIVFAVEFTVVYPKEEVLYKKANSIVMKEKTRTQDFLTPLEVCFIESINTLELLELLNKKEEKEILIEETFCFLF